jgi:hypothetical protein
MTDNESEIIDLLGKGWSYSQIQEQLQVSSKTIAAAKKAYFPSMESSADVLSGDTFPLRPEPPPAIKTNSIETLTNKFTLLKTKQKMSKNNDYDEDDELESTKASNERYKIKLDHVHQMATLAATREEKERADNLKEQEMDWERGKITKEKLGLFYRIKKTVESCEDAEYSYEDAENMLEEAKEVLSESEKFCFMNSINFSGTESQSILKKVISILKDFLDNIDEDESADLEFDSTFRKLAGRATFHNF